MSLAQEQAHPHTLVDAHAASTFVQGHYASEPTFHPRHSVQELSSGLALSASRREVDSPTKSTATTQPTVPAGVPFASPTTVPSALLSALPQQQIQSGDIATSSSSTSTPSISVVNLLSLVVGMIKDSREETTRELRRELRQELRQEFETRISNLEARLAHEKTEKQALQASISELQATIEGLQADILDLQNSNRALKIHTS